MSVSLNKPNTTVRVAHIPECDLCKYDEGTTGVAAFADGKTRRGPWANMCLRHFESDGVGLGLGRGQRFVYIAKS